MGLLRLVPYGAQAFAALRDAIDQAKGGDALAPVTVAVPSNYAGLSLRRTLALEPGGLVNTRFLVFARVAELLGAPSLAARNVRPLASPVRAEAIRAALAEEPGIFHEVAEHTATERSLDATFRELRQANDASLDAIAQRSDRAGHVVRLFRSLRERTAQYYDEEDLANAAAEAVRAKTPALRDVGHVVLYLPRRMSPGERALAEALAEAHGLSAVIGLTGDDEADTPSRKIAARLEQALGGSDEEACPPPPTGSEIVAVADAEEEVRTALRLIVERLRDGTPLHRMAVLYPSAAPYALLAHEIFHGAGVAHNGPAVRTLAQTMSGRTLLGLLRLKELDFRRDALMDWLSAAPVLRERNGSPAPAHRWDTLSRSAGIVGGAAQWQARLEGHRRWLQERLALLSKRDDTNTWQTERIERDIEHTERLAAFVAELADVTSRRLRTWAEHASWAGELLERYLGGEGHRARWPDDEIQAHRSVDEALTALAGLDEVRERTDESTFRRALERELEAPAARIGRFGHGVFIGRARDAMGTSFDHVFFVGMSEGLMPPRSREDPLLPDRERAGLEEEIPLRTERRAEDRRDYLAALASAPSRTLIFPRADLRGQRGRLPARWLLETASSLAGKETMFTTELETLRAPWSRIVPSFEGALGNGLEAASEQEYALRSVLRWTRGGKRATDHFLALDDASLREGLLADIERHSKEFTRWDGHIEGLEVPVPSAERAVSPTALQNYASCPFRYFLGHVLYVAETEKPEDTLAISPLERGNLIHHALEEFIDAAAKRETPEQPWSAEERAQLMAIGERLCDEAQAKGVTGRGLLWRLHRARIMRDLAGFLDKDEDLRRRYGVVPEAVELAFGVTDAEEKALIVSIGGREIAFRGRIDRVDRAPDGSRLVVIDYKTGSQYGVKELREDPVRKGQALQLPIYGLAARRTYGDVDTNAYYWFASEKENYDLAGFELTEREFRAFDQALGVITSGIEAGAFPARPGKGTDEGYTNCRFCAFDAACARDRSRAWTRVKDADALAAYVELAEGES